MRGVDVGHAAGVSTALEESLVDTVESEVRKLLRVDTKFPATVIAELIGRGHSTTTPEERLQEIRPE